MTMKGTLSSFHLHPWMFTLIFFILARLQPVHPLNLTMPYQRFDGWYNNLMHPDWGSAGHTLTSSGCIDYQDETAAPSGWDRPNPREISNVLFGREAGTSGVPNKHGRTALFAHFGQIVRRELLDTNEVTCPIEIIETDVPRGDPEFDSDSTGQARLPYERVLYDKATGHAPNTPRRQINKASSYIDASFLYGNSIVRVGFLRERGSGKLACEDKFGWFPLKNDVNLAYSDFTYTNRHQDPEKLWRLGDKYVYENPAVLALSLIFYRLHNKKVGEGMERNPSLTNDEYFEYGRRWVVATLQKLIVHDWLPKLLGEDLPPYTGYKPYVQSDVSNIFDAGAINYIMTLIPPAINKIRESCQPMNSGRYPAERLCRTYWNAMETVYSTETGAAQILRGLSSQLAEQDDTYVIEDIRSRFYGPLYHSRLDAVAQTILKGRDFGLSDYNNIRKHLGLSKVKRWEDINSWMTENNTQLLNKFKKLHNSDLSTIDMFVGGMMETTPDGIGELFKTILRDQFIKIRDGDRFWFENRDNGLFSENDIQHIKNTTLADIIAITTKFKLSNFQTDVFTVTADNSCGKMVIFNESQLEPCPRNKGYNFFKGSEIPFIIIWTCLGLLPLMCIFAAYLLAKCKRWRHRKRVRELKLESEKRRILRRTISSSSSVHDAMEWRGSQSSRAVELHITTRGSVEVFSTAGLHLRTIKVSSMPNLSLKTSSNKKRNFLLIAMPKEYDLVVEFPTELKRSEFETVLNQLATSLNVQVTSTEIGLVDLQKSATTKEKRNKMLEKFFKTIFSEAFQMDYNPSLDNSQLDMRKQTEEILEVELSKEEFAEAMAVKANSAFVEHFFSLIDSDRNGYISFREFLNAVVLFSKGSTHEKLQTMFYMYDIDGKGYLSKRQIGQMFKSLLELAQSDLGREHVDQLIESLRQQSGMQDKSEYSFEDFCQLLSPQMGKLYNVSFDWKGLSKVLPTKLKTSRNGSVVSETDTRQRTSIANSTKEAPNMTMPSSIMQDRFEAVREQYTPVKAKVKLVKHFIENYRQHIFFLILFYGVCAGLFIERFYYYTYEQENNGYRKFMSYGISVTRGAAAAMSFTFSLLLLTMCRNTITYLRSTAVNLFIPFDSLVSFHKIVAWTALFFSALHILGYSFNFYHLVSEPTRFLCVFKSLVFRHTHPTFQWWLFQTITGFTGVLLVLVLCILYVFATQTARRYIFNWFWLTHKLFIVLYVLTLIHGASTVVQKPLFYVYFTGPALLFTLDKLVSLSRKKTEICILKAQNLPSDVTMIEFKRPPRFEYKSGQWVRIACLAQGKDEYHPFTLTSAPHEDTLKLHIRALGPWTWTLRHTFDENSMKPAKVYPKLYLDGPYGAGQQDWYQYDVSVLVGAGIGVTPYASILKDFVHMASINMTYKVKCQKLYFIWITGSQRHFEWLIDILREVEEIDHNGTVSIDIFITQFFQNFDLRTSMLYIFEEHFQRLNGGKSVFTGLKATTHFGRPQMLKIMEAVHKTHPQVRKVGVFSCGPPGVTKGVERACAETSKQTKALFEHHYENF